MKKVLIDVRDDIYDTCVNEYHNGTPFVAETVIARGKVLSDMTNGDVIRTLFPNAKWWVNEDNEVFTDMPWKPEKCIYFDLDWWHAPYKTEKWVNFAEELKDVFEEEVEE